MPHPPVPPQAETHLGRTTGQQGWAAACRDSDEWDKPGPPFRIYGQSYYVGTCGISAILIASETGHTLIDTGTDAGARIVLDNIRALGFEPEDVTTILMSHEHFDHVGGMARIQAATSATILASAEAAEVLRRGLPSENDPQAGSNHPPFPPVTGAIEIVDEGPLSLSSRTVHAVPTPGHTRGAMSWAWRECEGEACETLVYIDSMNPISDNVFRFSDNPELVAAFVEAIEKIGSMRCGIALAPHPAAANLRPRLMGKAALIDSAGCRRYAETANERLTERLTREARDGG
ncbi:subclass B3 metallo-beta-lactamase [Altererythrobacter aurantiacus]|uniref:Subclass B3 metallo-beta-lactamase n=1 Tax=Parapontixanthobacter aurantiacus TaxID=1463599 RepID=A0A844ZDY7_9SPHN|nr:subclass B3 metallo-beta-lactamase [Parapontixanthobacter aurantiacus]MXO85462.1 subclass B3 metallo-beta-lactamase [Parapontixanthobacter aurantiacus]